MPQIPVFVINLKRSEDRRARVQEALGSLSLTYEFIEAVDGNDLSEHEVAEIREGFDDPRKIDSTRGPVSRGEIGCAISHLKAYKRIVKDNLDYACIMEDDVVIKHAGNLRTVLERDTLLALNKKTLFGLVNLFPTWPNIYWVALNFPYVSNLAGFNMSWRRVKIKEGLYAGRPCVAPVWGNVCYIVTKEASEILLKEGRSKLRLADQLTSCADVFGVKTFVIYPTVVGHDHDRKSTIDTHENIRKSKVKLNKLNIWQIARISFVLILKKLRIIPYEWLVRRHAAKGLTVSPESDCGKDQSASTVMDRLL